MTQRATQGLYSERFEHDSCGFGLIADLKRTPTRWVVETAISSLSNLTHRGAVAADGKTGDGCGILIHRPSAFLRNAATEAGLTLGRVFTAGNVFLPRDPAQAQGCERMLEHHLRVLGLAVNGWRDVPTDINACGESAKATLPLIRQIFVSAPAHWDEVSFSRALFLARRRAERALSEVKEFYVVTLSTSVLAYKGMVMPGMLTEFYPDLARADLISMCVVFHQRFSTNSRPSWRLAQPFRFLAHNGEINTIEGNRHWACARAPKMQSEFIDFSEFNPLVALDGSDSESLDNMLEVYLAGGMDLLQAMRILVPPAYQANEGMDADLAAFYEFYALHTEPWDGPAGLVLCDGHYAACALDRNGLRPARYMLTSDNILTIASETGVWECAPSRIVSKGRLGPGEMIAVDLKTGVFLDDAAINRINAQRAPFKSWLKAGVLHLESDLIDASLAAQPMASSELKRFQKLFNLTREERDSVLAVLAETELEATGSMGDDTPISVLSLKNRSLYDYFRQAFAQVTNPPIDPLRESVVMSLATQIGHEGNVFELSPSNAEQVILNSPILSQRKVRQILQMERFANSQVRIELNYPRSEGLHNALTRLCSEAEAAVRAGAVLVLLSDRSPSAETLPVHALLATGAIHAHLSHAGVRPDCNLLVETATARDAHHFACLIGFGATAVYPYLAYQTLFDLGRTNKLKVKADLPQELGRSYRRGIRKGLLKIISKMGISTIGSYRGAQLFEIVGLSEEVVARCFAGTPSRIKGATFADLEADQIGLSERAWSNALDVEPGGLLKFVYGGEYHMYNPDVINGLQLAVRSGDYALYRNYADSVNSRPPSTLRDLLDFAPGLTPIPLSEVEPVEAILKRFDSAGMSLGALSPEAHEALAIAMNRLGSRSNSGEGGEDPKRYGTEKSSKIKQVASGRFGVTPEYLINAEVLQIKIAQGAKPGEGGQLPGHKVNEMIATLRFAKPGIGLISPPPHHDIYSIEDLAQLIFDLKEINPQALVSVKLVSHAGVGTIAAGVVKAYADLITISGYDGGTGASPLSSIKYAGTPWELGLSEAQQTLRLNGLRHKVRLQTDGGLKTGLDVIKAAILGAESFGFGTAPMVALGCKYLRICHLNNCATGVATQHEQLRKQFFTGLPEMVMNYFRFVAEDTRELLASIGVRTIEELVGRTEFLIQGTHADGKLSRLDLSPLLHEGLGREVPYSCLDERNRPWDEGALAQKMVTDLSEAIAHKTGAERHYTIRNFDRAIGARISGLIARAHGNYGMAKSPLLCRFTGAAGQSFGAWNAGGLHLHLTGDANDGVGKGMADGKIVLQPPADAGFVARDTVIMGNTCLYGATGGELYAAGQAGERFAVRNSGATAVIEGAGDHCCEYMTGGIVAVLGRTGINFGAGFTGGFAYVLDEQRDFFDRYNHELIDIVRISPEGMENHLQHLRALIGRHISETGSAWGSQILNEFRDFLPRFWLAKPKAASIESLIDSLRRAA